ncbi:hypothetical protein SEA_VORRPS_85 [Mycobacterium phage Vorrps]|nr:hypothetical protein SEA_VORRPS_85 [Mycobacterium phage Vorrps]QFP97130.1 hypothetical protein SEA_KRILI_84 [Mycobacterium phage Krili]QOC58516.1 hypothetical protein SEA_SHIDA_84 [Mycobacterium phage Shida]QXO13457.1 hypothetical protein SEA_MURAI_85 [Mycobacterium phage Murai]UAW08436.1 hypothetical protein SEA_MORI_85 [Mycobacterium phage Mori]WNO28670.1 hypothetical protein SEA_MADKILLAH_86 [Mycobacterium phage MadKillah]
MSDEIQHQPDCPASEGGQTCRCMDRDTLLLTVVQKMADTMPTDYSLSEIAYELVESQRLGADGNERPLEVRLDLMASAFAAALRLIQIARND